MSFKHAFLAENVYVTAYMFIYFLGTFTVLSIMVGSVTERLAPDEFFLKTKGTNLTLEMDVAARDAYRVQVAAVTTFLGGLIQVWQTVQKV